MTRQKSPGRPGGVAREPRFGPLNGPGPRPASTPRFIPWLLGLALGLAACRGPAARPAEPLAQDPSASGPGTPAAAPLAAPGETAPGWRAEVLLDVAPTGIWCVAPFEVFPQYAETELVALDDLGRAHVIISYGGRWTVQSTGPEGSWLGVAASADVDPRIAGPEIYLGAESGRLWQLVGHRREGVIDRRLIAQLDGRPIHALVAGQFGPQAGQNSLLAFTEPAEVWRLTPKPVEFDGFEAELLSPLDGRVRQAIAVDVPGGGQRALCASRSGWVGWIDAANAAAPEKLHSLDFGRGRLALSPGSTTAAGAAYSTAEDGTIWKHRWAPGVEPLSRRIFRGPMGPRGIACGRFNPDDNTESVAIFGYSGSVQLLTPPPSGDGEWNATTLFTDRDPNGTVQRGHYLARVELDGRNDTDELVLCGYSGRVTLLARRF